MKLIKTKLEGVYIIEYAVFTDNRGLFLKTFHKDFFKNNNLCEEFKEGYYSVSSKNVIRGMHFQLPPYDHEKLVYVPKGKIIDVVLDLRKDAKTYGEYISVELSEQNRNAIYISKGFAHGFESLENDTITVYSVSTIYNKESDSGIKYNSFGFEWNAKCPIVSERDESFESFKQFKTSF